MANLVKENFDKGLSRIQSHFLELNKKNSNGVGLEKANDVQDTVIASLDRFSNMLLETRAGTYIDPKRGQKVAPIDLSLEKALIGFYGCTTDQWLKAMGIFKSGDTLDSAARALGCQNLSKQLVEDLMISHGNFSAPNNVPDINAEFRFVIPELIGAAIRTGYEHSSQHQNWIGSTQNMTNRKMKMPQILRGDGNPAIINEGADIPVGSIAFGQKEVNVFKVGTGFNLTDELIMESSLDHIFIFLGEVGNDMAISTDQHALKILLNGEQTDGSESAPVIGVDTITELDTVDMRRIQTRMNRLRNNITRAILSEDDGNIDLNETRPEREEVHIDGYLGVTMDNQTLPTDQSLYLNAQKAMTKLQFGSMTNERRRNPRNQTEEIFVSNHIGFAIVRRDARIVIDKSVTFAANSFPAYMDIDARLDQVFAEF